MKTKNLLFATVLSCIIAIGMTSCSAKMQAINQLESLSNDLRDNSSEYTVKDWENAAKRFIHVREKISKHELEYSSAEKERIGRLEGKCAGYMARGLKDGLFDKIDGFKNELRGIIRGLFGTIVNDANVEKKDF